MENEVPEILEKNQKKVCTGCGVEKVLDDFTKDKRLKSGKRARCRVCRQKQKNDWSKKNEDKEAKREQLKLWKKNNPDYQKQYTKNNPEKIAEIKRRYYEAHKKEIYIKSRVLKKKEMERDPVLYHKKNNELGRRWRINNPEKYREILKRSNEKRKKNPQVKLHIRITSRIRSSLRGNKKGRSWESLVGYSCQKLHQHIEKKFLPGMTWVNMEEWHIDHIIPVSAFNFQKSEDTDFKKCWALKNLQPLWSLDNLKKSNHLTKPHQPSLCI